MDLVYNWCGDRDQPKVLFSNTLTHTYDFKVRVTEFLCQSFAFNSAYFPDHMMDLVYILYDDKYWSKVQFSNTLALANDPAQSFIQQYPPPLCPWP